MGNGPQQSGQDDYYPQSQQSGPQATPEMQIDSDIPYDESNDPF
jgi:hypothetical protein